MVKDKPITQFICLLKKIKRKMVDSYHFFVAKYFIKKLKNKNNNHDKIKVCFLVQMSEIWDKQILLYEKLKKDNRFFVNLVVVPPFDFLHKKIGLQYTDDYFFINYPDAIKAYENGKWINLKDKMYDYVFYQRPYNGYLPHQYRSTVVVRYSKCCYVPYAFWPLKEMLCGYNKDFFGSVYFAFMDSAENVRALCQFHNISEDRMMFCGYPSLENVNQVVNYTPTQILWTPRWEYDEKIGGSHFFEYKDGIVDYCAEKEVNLTIRPHPLAFENYIAKGLMTEKELQYFKEKVEQSGAKFDKNKLIEKTFETTGILISDVSSIIFTYFATSKPIIYCNSTVSTSPSFNALLDGMYVANNLEDVIRFLNQLNNGIDPLKKKRVYLAQKLANENKNASTNIIDKLVEDSI